MCRGAIRMLFTNFEDNPDAYENKEEFEETRNSIAEYNI